MANFVKNELLQFLDDIQKIIFWIFNVKKLYPAFAGGKYDIGDNENNIRNRIMKELPSSKKQRLLFAFRTSGEICKKGDRNIM
jgi:hypothetical protein